MRLVALIAALLPGFSPVATGPAGGIVLQGVMPGSAPDRAGYVYLPPGFTTSRRYPVVYLLHGMPGAPVEYVHSLRLADVADTLIASHETQPFVAVMPVAGDDAHYNGEWTGPWEDEVVRDVVPWADSHLPTIASASGRVLAGLSAGGYGAIDIALRHPGMFGTVESWSGYFRPLLDGTLKGASKAEVAAHDPTKLVRSAAPELGGTRFYLSTGPDHGKVRAKDTVAFAAELRSLGLRYKLWLPKIGEAKAAYAPQLAAGLRFAFGPPSGAAA
jgi:enterochelin esterase-like enzyme